MNILVTGSNGFVGRNLVENLKNIRDGKNRTRPGIRIDSIYEYDRDEDKSVLLEACKNANFVFNLAGINRPKKISEFMDGNFGFAMELLECLKSNNNTCPVMLSSSIQATLTGRFADSEYGKSKLAGEKLFFKYSAETGAKVLVYRLSNLFGKWCKPNYNSAVATFCNAVANDESYTISNRDIELELIYIDDLITELLDAIENKEHHCEYEGATLVPVNSGKYCHVPIVHHATLGAIADLLKSFNQMSSTFVMPEIPEGSFVKKLYSTYLSYLPDKKMSYALNEKVDNRGIFAELIKTKNCGQVSVNVARPGNVRGQHWHNSKWEVFIVVSGHGLIQERKIGIDPQTGKEYPVHSFDVTGEKMRAVQMLPGYAHSIINLSDTENLVTVMWANEIFDENYPDTFFEAVEKKNNKKANV